MPNPRKARKLGKAGICPVAMRSRWPPAKKPPSPITTSDTSPHLVPLSQAFALSLRSPPVSAVFSVVLDAPRFSFQVLVTMSGEAWLYLFAVLINAVNLFLQVFFTIMYSDLEW
jgi:hypothetical protein